MTSSEYQSFALSATSFSKNKTLKVPYFSIFDNIRPQSYLSRTFFSMFNNLRTQPYLILAFSIIQDPSRTLFWYFKQIYTPAIPFFSILNRIKPQQYFSIFNGKKPSCNLLLLFGQDPSRTLAVPYLSTFNENKPKP